MSNTMSANRLVKDYKGNLIPKVSARRIAGFFYKENESCFLMEDGQWYRIDSPKVVFDHFTGKHVLQSNSSLLEGIINISGDRALFSSNAPCVQACEIKGGPFSHIMTEEIALKLGYEECIGDGLFYKKINLTAEDLKTWFIKKDIPKNERSSSYNLEQDPDRKRQTIEQYEKSVFPISVSARRIAKYIPFTIGMEVEVINGFVPRRIRNKYGLKALKDGSLRSDSGEGIEYVTMPMSGPKGIQTIINSMKEFSKRCAINNYCSLHFHFGNVRKDKLYILSLYKLISMIQGELKTYFPFSRFNSIKPDGKVYCKPLDNLGINYESIKKANTEESFRKVVIAEFNKIYGWMNNGRLLAEEFDEPTIVREVKEINGKKMFCDKWMRNMCTTKEVHHAVTGQKWDKAARYYLVNFLNLFFSKIGTIEFRCHESTTNANKSLIWLLTCSAILKYAEDVNTVIDSKTIKLSDVIKDQYPADLAEYINEYYEMRNKTFFTGSTYREKWTNIENNWFNNDPKFSFTSSKNYKLI